MNNIPASIVTITLYLARFKTEIQYTYFQLSNTMIIWAYVREECKTPLKTDFKKTTLEYMWAQYLGLSGTFSFIFFLINLYSLSALINKRQFSWSVLEKASLCALACVITLYFSLFKGPISIFLPHENFVSTPPHGIVPTLKKAWGSFGDTRLPSLLSTGVGTAAPILA